MTRELKHFIPKPHVAAVVLHVAGKYMYRFVALRGYPFATYPQKQRTGIQVWQAEGAAGSERTGRCDYTQA